MQVMTWSGPETRHVSAAAVLVKPDITDVAPFPTILQVMTWSGPETRHVAAAAARWVPSAFILLKEYCRTGDSEASLEAVKVDGGRWRGGRTAGGDAGWLLPSAFLLLKDPACTGGSEAGGQEGSAKAERDRRLGFRFPKGQAVGWARGAGGEEKGVGACGARGGLLDTPPLSFSSPPPLALHQSRRACCARARPSTCGCTQTSPWPLHTSCPSSRWSLTSAPCCRYELATGREGEGACWVPLLSGDIHPLRELRVGGGVLTGATT